MNRFKAQSAIEYLMTYGWMLLVVAITGGAVFSVVSGQSIESVSGFEESDINVEDFGLSRDQLSIVVANPTPNQVEIKQLTVSQNGQNVSIPQGVSMTSDSAVVSTPFIAEDEGTNTLDIEIDYNSANLKNLTSTGVITGPYRLQRDEDLIGYYSMNEEHRDGSTMFELSGMDNHGEIRNIDFISTSRGTSGEFNPVCEFEDTSICDTEDESWTTARVAVNSDGEIGQYTFSEDDEFSVSAWIKIVGGETDRRTYYVGRGHTARSYGLFFNPSDRVGGRTRGSSGTLSLSETVEQNEFIHTVMTYNPEEGLYFYIGGELQAIDNDADVEDLASSSSSFLGGDHRPSGTNSDGPPGFGEVLDTVTVFNKSLAQEEVLELYERQR